MPNLSQEDPFRAYNFLIEIEGVEAGYFTECSGLDMKITALRYREGGGKQVVRRLPGQVEYGDIKLRYGLSDNSSLWDWIQEIAAGNLKRRNISIIMLGVDSNEKMRWNIFNAWPSQWRGAPLDALSSDVAIEEVSFVFESLERD